MQGPSPAALYVGESSPARFISSSRTASYKVSKLPSQVAFTYPTRRTKNMETLTRTTASAARSTAETTRDIHRLQEITAVETSHIIQEKIRLYIIAALSLLWLSAQLQRYIARNPNAGCWYGWDALALAAVAYFCKRNQYAIACVFTSAYFVWTRLPGSPFNDLHLPSFDNFLKTTSEQNTSGVANRGAVSTTDDLEDAPACLVCWSSDEKPVALPCNHFMCQECLSTMKGRQQTCCPLCRRPLFHNNDGMRCAVHKAVVATLAARLISSGIILFLQLWHGQYWEVVQSAVTYFPQFYCFRVLQIVVLTQGVEWWQFGMFDYLMPLPLPDWRFWRSVWPAVMFTLVFSVGVSGDLRNIGKLDLMVERVVHREPFTQLYAS
jgi:hypothetical protein